MALGDAYLLYNVIYGRVGLFKIGREQLEVISTHTHTHALVTAMQAMIPCAVPLSTWLAMLRL